MQYNQTVGLIYKEVIDSKLKWICCVDGCQSYAINSHFLQKKGVLNLLAVDNHLVELVLSSPFSWKKNTLPFQFKKVGIKKAISIKLFCNEHDNSIFSPIETGDIDFSNYEDALLLSYRITCAELRKKQINFEIFSRFFESPQLENLSFDYIDQSLNGAILGINDLLIIKEIFESELNKVENVFQFHCYEYPRLELYASAIFSPTDAELNDLNNDELELANIFIHIIPTKLSVKIIVGYHKKFCNEWMRNYSLSWGNLSERELELRISELIICRIENWGISEKLFNNISKEKLDEFVACIIKQSDYTSEINTIKEFNFFEKN